MYTQVFPAGHALGESQPRHIAVTPEPTHADPTAQPALVLGSQPVATQNISLRVKHVATKSPGGLEQPDASPDTPFCACLLYTSDAADD